MTIYGASQGGGKECGERHALRGAGIATHEVVRGTRTAGELRRLVVKLVPKPEED